MATMATAVALLGVLWPLISTVLQFGDHLLRWEFE